METYLKKLIVIALGMGLFAAGSARAADAKENWTKHCAKCHGEDGKGETKMGKKAGCKDLTDAKLQESKKDDALFKSIKEGMKQDDKTVMKAFGEEGLSDDEIKALVARVRSLKK
jgi:cytochrome c6